MDQYTQITPKIERPIVEDKEQKTLESKVKTLEDYVLLLESEIKKMRRDILRLKDDINAITTTLRRG
jgi:uncharacterized protein YdcH (DUF465 family)